VLGPEMRSTGEVMGIDADFPRAFAKSQDAAYGGLPSGGTVFVQGPANVSYDPKAPLQAPTATLGLCAVVPGDVSSNELLLGREGARLLGERAGETIGGRLVPV